MLQDNCMYFTELGEDLEGRLVMISLANENRWQNNTYTAVISAFLTLLVMTFSQLKDNSNCL